MSQLEHPQYQLMLLRHCAGMPKLNYVLRTSCAHGNLAVLETMDKAITDGLVDILGPGGLDEWRRAKAGLPLRLTGLGITQPSKIALPAFVGALFDVFEKVQQLLKEEDFETYAAKARSMLAIFNAEYGQTVSMEEIMKTAKRQHFFTTKVHDLTWEKLEAECDGFLRTFLHAKELGHVSDWTDMLPYAGQRMDADSYRESLRAALGMQILSEPKKCPYCGGIVDVFGIHTKTCPGRHQYHHNVLRDKTITQVKRTHLTVAKEPPHLIHGNKSRPADLMIVHFRDNRNLCIDVSIVEAHAGGYSPVAGRHIANKEKEKRRKYEEQLNRNHMDFVPFVMDTLGCFGEAAKGLLKSLGNAMRDVDQLTAAQSAARLRKMLQFTWQAELGAALVSVRRSV